MRDDRAEVRFRAVGEGYPVVQRTDSTRVVTVVFPVSIWISSRDIGSAISKKLFDSPWAGRPTRSAILNRRFSAPSASARSDVTIGEVGCRARV